MIISKTPFRISLAGGGSDIDRYYQTSPGAVVAMSVSLYMYVTVNTRFDDTVRVSYTRLEIVKRAADLKHDLIRAALEMAGLDRGVEITTIADVPGGTGLGSSSSLTVGVLNALYAYRGIRLSATELARKACEIEIDVLKRPIGKQDQFMAACGGLRRLTFHANGRVGSHLIRSSPLTAKKLVDSLMLFYTGIERDGNAILRHVRNALANDHARRDRVARMVADAHDLGARLERGDISTVGSVLNGAWSHKRDFGAPAVQDRLDVLHRAVIAAGASGAKILGAGGGGFLLVQCSKARKAGMRRTLGQLGLREIRFGLEEQGSQIIFPSSVRALRQSRQH